MASSLKKYDLHTHVLGGSSDSKFSAEDYVLLLKNNGYSGIVTTDHYSDYTLFNYHKATNVKDGNKRWLNGYRSCLEPFNREGLTVMLGAEYALGMEEYDVHILIYGLTEDIVFKRWNDSLSYIRAISCFFAIIMI